MAKSMEHMNNDLATRKVPMLACQVPRLASFVLIRENMVTRKDPHGPKPYLGGRRRDTRMCCPISPPPFKSAKNLARSMSHPPSLFKMQQLQPQVDSARLP